MTDRPTTESIWAHLGADLRRFLRRRVPDDHAADDLLQETFVRVHRHLPALADAERVVAWVYQIARNVVRDHFRTDRATNAPVSLADADPAEEAGDPPARLPCPC